MYRTRLIRQCGQGFADGCTAGKSLHLALERAGFTMLFIGSEELMKHVRHLNHATMILNPRPGDRKTARASARRRLERELEELRCGEILSDNTLDRPHREQTHRRQ